MKLITCKQKGCKNKFKPRGIKKFCSHTCGTRFNARLRYNKLKNNPEFKAKQKIKWKNWINNNRAHYNDLCREPSRKYAARIRKERKAKGLCPKCGGKIDEVRWKCCSACRKKERIRRKKK